MPIHRNNPVHAAPGKGRLDRRAFLKHAALMASAASASALLGAEGGVQVGLELFTVRAELAKDFAGTLRRAAQIGYKSVEPYSFLNQSAPAVRDMLNSAGLKMPAGHYKTTELSSNLDGVFKYSETLGIHYIICSSPGVADAGRPTDFKTLAPTLTMDDWNWMADLFNRSGERCRKAGFEFGYHSHNVEFRETQGKIPLDELMSKTDPKLVSLEMDCGWISRAGRDPVAFLKKFSGRIPVLHVKDLRPGYKVTTDLDPSDFVELGRGVTDWRRVFSAAREAGVKHYFYEQDQTDLPPFEAARISYEYLRKLNV